MELKLEAKSSVFYRIVRVSLTCQKNKFMYIRIFVLLVVTVLFSCQSSDSTCTLDEDRLEGRVDLTIQRLEPAFFGAETKEEMLDLLEKYPDVTSRALGVDTYPNMDSLAGELVRLHQDSSMQELNKAVAKEFADLSDVKVELIATVVRIRNG